MFGFETFSHTLFQSKVAIHLCVSPVCFARVQFSATSDRSDRRPLSLVEPDWPLGRSRSQGTNFSSLLLLAGNIRNDM